MESWWPLSAWLSPGAALFVFFNVLVGAVAVMSRAQQGGPGRRLCRSASSMVLDRLRSFSMFSVHPAAQYTSPEAEEERPMGGSAPEPVAEEPPSAPVATAAADAATASVSEDEAGGAEDDDKSVRLDVATCQATRLSSSAPAAEAAAAVEKQGKEKPAKVAPESIKRRWRGREAEGGEGKAELNERADRFILQFREELRLQRLDSLISYTRALGRRAGVAGPANG